MSIKNLLIILIAATGIVTTTNAQVKNDTVKIPLAKTSQIIFTMKDRSDLETLKHYNFQELFMDLLAKIEHPEDTASTTQSADTTNNSVADNSREEYHREEYRSERSLDDDKDDDWEWHGSRKHWGRTWQSFN